MREEKGTGVFRAAAWIVCAAGVFVGGYWLLKIGLPLLLPFLLAWGMALMLRPLAGKMSTHTHIPHRVCAFLLMLLTLLLLGLLLTLAVNRLLFELQRLFTWLGEDGGLWFSDVFSRIGGWFTNLTESMPFLDGLLGNSHAEGLWQGLDEMVENMITQAVTELSTRIPTWIASILRALPAILLFVAAWVLACFYFCLDLERIHAALRTMVPAKWRRNVGDLRRRAAGTALRWLRAYLLLLGLTFGELLIGFAILGVDYAFLLALLIALIDVLPVLGVGTVLLPWAAVVLMGGQYSFGVGLIILYAVVLIVRQIAEPRIIGGSIGLHPLLTLAAMYIGFRLFGVAGIFLSPAAALAFSMLAADSPKS